jgi:hypothetical protein
MLAPDSMNSDSQHWFQGFRAWKHFKDSIVNGAKKGKIVTEL